MRLQDVAALCNRFGIDYPEEYAHLKPSHIQLHRNAAVGNEELNALFTAAWDSHQSRDFTPILRRSLVYITAYCGMQLVGFLNVAWDGGMHGFIVDPTVLPGFRARASGWL